MSPAAQAMVKYVAVGYMDDLSRMTTYALAAVRGAPASHPSGSWKAGIWMKVDPRYAWNREPGAEITKMKGRVFRVGWKYSFTTRTHPTTRLRKP